MATVEEALSTLRMHDGVFHRPFTISRETSRTLVDRMRARVDGISNEVWSQLSFLFGNFDIVIDLEPAFPECDIAPQNEVIVGDVHIVRRSAAPRDAGTYSIFVQWNPYDPVQQFKPLLWKFPSMRYIRPEYGCDF